MAEDAKNADATEIRVKRARGRSKKISSSQQVNPIVWDRAKSEPTVEHLLQDGDDLRAEFIRKSPLALLRSIEHQDAVCRWRFASKCLPKGDARDRAEALLNSIEGEFLKQTKHGRFDAAQLRQAYKDIVCYTEMWFACIQTLGDQKKVKKQFPDCERMKPVVTAIRVKDAGDSSLSFDQIMDKVTVKPNPSDVACEYIQQVLGISRSTLYGIIGRGNSPRS